MDLISEIVNQSWGWMVGIGLVGVLILIVLFMFVKALVGRVLAIIIVAILVFSGGYANTYAKYKDDAEHAGTTVVEYIKNHKVVEK